MLHKNLTMINISTHVHLHLLTMLQAQGAVIKGRQTLIT